MLTAGQYRHGLARALLLVQPSRTALHASHLGTAALVGAALGVLDAGLGVAAQATSGQLHLTADETTLVAAGLAAATTAATIIGAAIGTMTRSLPLAAAAPLLWIYVVETADQRLGLRQLSLRGTESFARDQPNCPGW